MSASALEYRVAGFSIALLIASFLIYILVCIVRRKPLDLSYLPRILPFAGLPTIITFLYGAFDPSFLIAECKIAPDCLSWSVRIVLALGGLFALILFFQGIGLIRLHAGFPESRTLLRGF